MFGSAPFVSKTTTISDNPNLEAVTKYDYF